MVKKELLEKVKEEVINKLNLSNFNPSLLHLEGGNYCDSLLIDVTYDNQYIGIYNPRIKMLVEYL